MKFFALRSEKFSEIFTIEFLPIRPPFKLVIGTLYLLLIQD